VVWFCYKLPINGRDALRWVSFAFCFALLLIHTDRHPYTHLCMHIHNSIAIEYRILLLSTSHQSPTRRMLNFWCIPFFGAVSFAFVLACHTSMVLANAILFWIVRRCIQMQRSQDPGFRISTAPSCPIPIPTPIRSSVVLNSLRFLWFSLLCLPIWFLSKQNTKYKMQRCKFSSFCEKWSKCSE